MSQEVGRCFSYGAAVERFFHVAAAFLFALSLALGLLAFRPSEPRGGPSWEEPAWQWHQPDQRSLRELPQRFNLAVDVSLPSPSAVVRLALLAEEKGDTGIFVDVSAGHLAFGRLEGGIPLRRCLKELPSTPSRVELRRRGAKLVVIVDENVSLLAMEPLISGKVLAIATANLASAQLASFSRLGEFPEFADDFMRTPKEPSPWTVHFGKWHTSELPTPSMSANAFSYLGTPGEDGHAFASAGDELWDEYRAEVSARGSGNGAVGLAFGVRKDRYALFRWSSRGADGRGGRRELVLVSPHEELVVASAEGGYLSGQWYRLAVELSFGRARAFIDGAQVLEAEHPAFSSGAIGLWSSGPQGASFDDVLVTPKPSLEEVFAGPSARDWSARWDALGGEWSLKDGALICRAAQHKSAPKLLTGERSWRRIAVVAEVASPQAGIIANYRDESDYTLLRLHHDRLSLERIQNGVHSVLDEAPLPNLPQGASTLSLRLETDRGYIAGYAGHTRLVEAWDKTSQEGRVGMWCPSGGTAAFKTFAAEFLPHRPPIAIVNPVFESDNIMAGWAGDSADWYRSDESAPGRDVFWHLAPFHGDAELAIDLPEPTEQRGRLVLGISKTADKPRNGYGWTVERTQDRAGWDLALTREAETVAGASLEKPAESVFLRRHGRYVVAGADGEVLACFRDPLPLQGARIAYLAEGFSAHPSRARVYGGCIYDYRFNEAPSDWRVGAGVWEVTSRWKCDPRWSFFSGRPDPASPDKLAVIWNKHRFRGDLVIDFYVGPKMEPEKGKRYEYARDFNVTIAADGYDLTSGYSFMFGGFGNSRSCILRGKEVLAQQTDPSKRIPASMLIHQRWYHMRVEKLGQKLRFRVMLERNPVLSMECEDPEPLQGDRVAIWTYDCGIMVARLRVAGESSEGTESPDFMPPGRIGTPYDDAEAER